MKYCKGCQLDLNDDQFNGDYRYCRNCYNNYRSNRQPRQRNKITKPTCVYFIRCNDLIKIGFTSDITERVSNLQVSNPTILEVLKTIAGGYVEEQALHKQFSHLNKTGEWFYATNELLDFIDELTSA